MYFVAGKILSPRGLKGHFKVESFMDCGDQLFEISLWCAETGAEHPRLKKVCCLQEGQIFEACFDGVTCREEAQQHTNLLLYAKNEDLPPLEDDHFYYHALEGMQVFLDAGQAWGTVQHVCNYGAGDLLEVLPNAEGQSVLVPFQKETVCRVDLEARQIYLTLEGQAFLS